MASRKVLLIAAAAAMAVVVGALLPTTASAWPANHVVGDLWGWNLGVNYTEWLLSSDRVNAGDTLEFVYDPAQGHTMVMMEEEDRASYDACVASNNAQTWNTGDDKVQLPYVGKFFICGVVDHCSQGMKFAITAF